MNSLRCYWRCNNFIARLWYWCFNLFLLIFRLFWYFICFCVNWFTSIFVTFSVLLYWQKSYVVAFDYFVSVVDVNGFYVFTSSLDIDIGCLHLYYYVLMIYVGQYYSCRFLCFLCAFGVMMFLMSMFRVFWCCCWIFLRLFL